MCFFQVSTQKKLANTHFALEKNSMSLCHYACELETLAGVCAGLR